MKKIAVERHPDPQRLKELGVPEWPIWTPEASEFPWSYDDASETCYLQKLVRRLPLDCLLVETDSPVLGPEPGRRNEPANLPLALAAVAQLKGIPLEQAAEAIAENTRRLYGF